MKEIASNGNPLIDVVLWVWFALAALAVAYVAHDQFKARPEPMENSLAMKTMRRGWVLITLYTGVFALIAYWFLHRASAGETLEPPLWKQTVESTIHGVPADATGILFATVVTVMAGMIPVMVRLMSQNMSAMEPSSVRFWGTMLLALMVGTAMTYPVNGWLAKHGLKRGTGGEAQPRVLPKASPAGKLVAACLTFVLLGSGVALAAGDGDFSMRSGEPGMSADASENHGAAN